MKLSLIFELLMIFVLLAFAASKHVGKVKNNRKGIQNKSQDGIKIEDNTINRYCKCSAALCNCCRDFQVPLVNLDGPGCASLSYVDGDKMSVSLSFGRKVITNRTLSSKKPTPVCMNLPGGLSKFCGRVYNIAKSGEEFRACLGLELQSKSTIEAAVRVSCFKFGPRGVTSEPADPLPLVPKDEANDDDDDDDDDEDDDFDLGDLDDDDDDDLDAVNDVGSADYTGFSLLGDDLLGDLFGSSDKKKPNKNKKKQAPLQSTTTTKRPRTTRRPTRRPSTSRTTTRRPATTKPTTTVNVRPVSTRRPIRRPSRRPTRRSTTTPAPPLYDIISLSQPTEKPSSPIVNDISTSVIQSTQPIKLTTTNIYKPTSVATEKIVTVPVTTVKPVTNFEDPGLQMSLASLAGQLSSMPVTPIIPEKESSLMTTIQETNFEKIQTITPRTTSSTFAFHTVSSERESSNEDMVQIVQSLDDSKSSESTEKILTSADESRGHHGIHNIYREVVPEIHYEGLNLKKHKKKNNDYDILGLPEDYDVLGLSEIGETVGEDIGVFGKKRRQHRNSVKNKQENNDFLGLSTINESFGILAQNGNNKKKNRKRENKMMRGDWAQV